MTFERRIKRAFWQVWHALRDTNYVSIRVPNSNGTILCTGKVARVTSAAWGDANRIGVLLDSCAIKTADSKEREAVSIPDALPLLCTTPLQKSVTRRA